MKERHMTIQETVESDWKDAVKARDPKKDTLSLIRTELKNKAINTRKGGDTSTMVQDDVALDVLAKMAKQRRESIVEYQKGGRTDLVDKEAFELAVIEAFLPKGLSDDEIRAIVKEAIAETGASSAKEMGKVMGAVTPKTKGRADGKRVQELVKEALG
jgi:uncharacterized protein YqeY